MLNVTTPVSGNLDLAACSFALSVIGVPSHAELALGGEACRHAPGNRLRDGTGIDGPQRYEKEEGDDDNDCRPCSSRVLTDFNALNLNFHGWLPFGRRGDSAAMPCELPSGD